jgi:hypothetical protein
MPVTIRSIVDSAEREWVHWGKSTWNVPNKQKNIEHTDDEGAFAQYVVATNFSSHCFD